MSEAPPILDPPQPPPIGPDPHNHEEKPTPSWAKKLGPLGTFLLVVAAKAKTVFAFLLPALKFLKLGKVLLTSSTMLLSIVVYSALFGWKFAVGFVVCIFVHEMGHVLAAKYYGIPVSAPVFIPLFGALILQKRSAKSAWIEAVIGIGGPLAGTVSALACWAIFQTTGNVLFLGLAYTAFFLNLFNMTPIFPLDGGWIVGAISPYLWAVGLVLMLAMLFTGHMTNPMIIVLILMSLPRVWAALKRGTADPEGGEQTTPTQKWTMGFAYVGLCAFLLWGMAITHDIGTQELRPRGTQVAALR
ncbi:MAG: hypothetical protein QOJ65_767 [Fimbriimonadaceae bacterium]|jgi:Zn-dependent protease|nr:hypothetical protein [Fimbriimonadaceae bacterium]